MKKLDEFFIARLRLTFYYTVTAILILGVFSIVLYNTIISNLTQSIRENIFLDPRLGQALIDRAKDILFSRLITIDVLIIFVIIIFGFLLTYKILQPIKSNMQKQKRFIADASHELRTPIAVVISGLEVNLENKNLDLVGAKKTLENTLEEMREFSKLSNNLLDLSKYDSMDIKHELVNVTELIKSIVEKNQSLAQVKNINIKANLQFSATVEGNEIELSRVFFNILDNAIKYTPQNGAINIADKITSQTYSVTISDTGVGIEKELLGKIFDPFFRADSSRSTEGAGLGLTLSKKIIENHKGTISIKSESGKGTNVIIRLPIAS